jgi:hypothetical protein
MPAVVCVGVEEQMGEHSERHCGGNEPGEVKGVVKKAFESTAESIVFVWKR